MKLRLGNCNKHSREIMKKMKIIKILYLIINIIISFFTVIFLPLNNFTTLIIRFSFSQFVLYYFAFNSILGIILTVKNKNHSEKIKLRWFIPSVIFLFIGLLYVRALFELLNWNLVSIGSLINDISLIVIYAGHFFYVREMIRIYNKEIVAKVYFSIMYPISVVVPMLACLLVFIR